MKTDSRQLFLYPPPLLLESLKPFCFGEKADFSIVGKMPNIHGNFEFFHFLYMFN